MPLTTKGERILSHMRKEYGSESKAKEVLYASKNAGVISGIDSDERVDSDIAQLRIDASSNYPASLQKYVDAIKKYKAMGGYDHTIQRLKRELMAHWPESKPFYDQVRDDSDERADAEPKSPGYNAEAVQKEINKDKRIKGKEASAIHRLLKGRHDEDGIMDEAAKRIDAAMDKLAKLDERLAKADAASDVNQARYLGKLAFKEGRASVPAQHKAFMEHLEKSIKGQPFGSSVPLLEAWSAGWHEANLAKTDAEGEAEIVTKGGFYYWRPIGTDRLSEKFYDGAMARIVAKKRGYKVRPGSREAA